MIKIQRSDLRFIDINLRNVFACYSVKKKIDNIFLNEMVYMVVVSVRRVLLWNFLLVLTNLLCTYNAYVYIYNPYRFHNNLLLNDISYMQLFFFSSIVIPPIIVDVSNLRMYLVSNIQRNKKKKEKKIIQIIIIKKKYFHLSSAIGYFLIRVSLCICN